jgi:predicted anti-sigma-YlaC factor YlaD
MACLHDSKIQEYIEGDLNNVEKSLVRDHLIACVKCRAQYDCYEKLEKNLAEPVYIMPPSIIEQNVLRMLFPRIPSYGSVFALLAASFLLLITSIYIYFDFANNSVVQAFQLSSSNTSNWIGTIIKTISAIFSIVYAVFKAINAFFEIIFKVNIGIEVIGLCIFIILSLGFYSFSHLLFKKIKGSH